MAGAVPAAGPSVAERPPRRPADDPEPRRDGTLTISVTCSQAPGNDCYDDVTVAVPAGTPVTASASLGDVRSVGFRADQDLTATLGLVAVRDLRTARLVVRSTDDDVRVVSSSIDRVTATSRSGAVRVLLGDRPASVAASSTDDDVRVTVPAGRYAVVADSRDGVERVRGLHVDPAAPSSVRATSRTGDVYVRGS